MANNDVFYNKLYKMLDEHKATAKQTEEERLRDMAARIRTYREREGLSQGQLAARLGVSLRQLIRWEKAENKPNNLALEKMRSFEII